MATALFTAALSALIPLLVLIAPLLLDSLERKLLCPAGLTAAIEGKGMHHDTGTQPIIGTE